MVRIKVCADQLYSTKRLVVDVFAVISLDFTPPDPATRYRGAWSVIGWDIEQAKRFTMDGEPLDVLTHDDLVAKHPNFYNLTIVPKFREWVVKHEAQIFEQATKEAEFTA